MSSEEKRFNAAVPIDESVVDTVVDGIDRLQDDGGVSPEIPYRLDGLKMPAKAASDTPVPKQ